MKNALINKVNTRIGHICINVGYARRLPPSSLSYRPKILLTYTLEDSSFYNNLHIESPISKTLNPNFGYAVDIHFPYSINIFLGNIIITILDKGINNIHPKKLAMHKISISDLIFYKEKWYRNQLLLGIDGRSYYHLQAAYFWEGETFVPPLSIHEGYILKIGIISAHGFLSKDLETTRKLKAKIDFGTGSHVFSTLPKNTLFPLWDEYTDIKLDDIQKVIYIYIYRC